MKAFRRLLILLMILGQFKSYAQLFKVDIDEKIGKSSLIVEGKVVDKKSFWNDAHTMIYTANTIEVYKVFKGDVSEHTIEIVTQGGAVGTQAVEVSDLLQLNKNKMGIFFCMANAMNLKSPATKKLLFDVYSSDQGFLRYDLKKDIAYAPFASYKGIEKNLYNIILQKTKQKLKTLNNSFKISSGNIDNIEEGGLATSISSFSPATVHGGTLNDAANNTLTINGSGFGAKPSGSCAVRFKDGNNDNATPDYEVPYTSAYFVSWSDTKIVIKVPSRAATGHIAVVTSNGADVESSTDLNVFYSVLNFEFDFSSEGVDTITVEEPRLMNTNSSGGYTFQYSTSTAGGGKNFATSPAKETFLRALATWKSNVGANLIEGDATAQQAIADDDVNLVVFDNKNTGVPVMASGVLEVTYSWGSTCFNKTPFSVFNAQKTGFDILIRNNGVSAGSVTLADGPCFPAAGTNGVYETDLEMIILHELGHALNLSHINDDLEQSTGNLDPLHINPGKLMHYAVANYVDRRSPDASAYTGALYTTTKQNKTYGSCGLFSAEMTQLSYTVVSTDECPATFPTSATAANTLVNFDLIHTTSNKLKDPQFTAVNCGVNNGQFVTNNAYYAIRTGSETSFNIDIKNYVTQPAELASCSGQGIRLAVYDVSTCPAGQNYPQPFLCSTFSGNGTITALTGLATDHTYLLYFDGLRNTKASFDAVLNSDGSVIPVDSGKQVVKVYPNPVNNILTISITDTVSGKYQFVLYDMLGKKLLTQSYDINPGTQIKNLSLFNLATGIYFLRAFDSKGNVVLKQKLMKGKSF